jgi:hypothetical protein
MRLSQDVSFYIIHNDQSEMYEAIEGKLLKLGTLIYDTANKQGQLNEDTPIVPHSLYL